MYVCMYVCTSVCELVSFSVSVLKPNPLFNFELNFLLVLIMYVDVCMYVR